MWTGTIDANKDDVPFFESLGIKVENWNDEKGEIYVILDDSALSKLDPYWGQFYWSLVRVD